MRYGSIDAWHDANRERQIAIFSVPFGLLHKLDISAADGPGGCATAYFHAVPSQALERDRQEFVGNPPIHENRLDGIAGGGSLSLGVENQRNRHLPIRRALHVDVAHTVGMTDHSNSRVGGDKANQIGTATRD